MYNHALVSVVVSVFAVAVLAQPPVIIQPGAPGEPSKVLTPDQATDLSQVQYTGADIKFMQGMIGHHTQALEMVALLQTRTQNADMKKMAERIRISQEDEIKMMQGWLAHRGQQVPTGKEHHTHAGMLMPGMLTEDEMKQLADRTGVAFDKLFLESMIRHHQGALAMVKDLFAVPGAAQDSDIFAFAADVEADQSAEIARMTAMREELGR
jgi:uncharacterized protein (DUF305 family)